MPNDTSNTAIPDAIIVLSALFDTPENPVAKSIPAMIITSNVTANIIANR